MCVAICGQRKLFISVADRSTRYSVHSSTYPPNQQYAMYSRSPPMTTAMHSLASLSYRERGGVTGKAGVAGTIA